MHKDVDDMGGLLTDLLSAMFRIQLRGLGQLVAQDVFAEVAVEVRVDVVFISCQEVVDGV